MIKPWKMGFVGAATDDLAIWVDETVVELELQSIAIPFFGSGKEVSLLARRSNIQIESWDVQHISALVVNLFTSFEVKTNIELPRLQKGWTYEKRPYKDMHDETAGLVDYIANNGTEHERLALATAIARCTFLGRLDQWDPSNQTSALWKHFQRRLEVQKDYTDLKGAILHHEADFYQTRYDTEEKRYDLLYIDPPKIVSTSDIYSRTFAALNRMVAPDTFTLVDLDRWTKYDYVGKMRGILDHVDCSYIMLAYTSGVRPGLSSMKDLFSEYGEQISEVVFLHRKRYDYGLVYRRTT